MFPSFPLVCAVLIAVACGWINSDRLRSAVTLLGQSPPNITLCPQVPPLFPTQHAELNAQLNKRYSSETFRLSSYQFLGDAIQIPTESYDDLLPVGQDERWIIFNVFHIFFEESFPRIYSSLTVTRVNTYGLVFHWQGSDDSVKPLLFAAHQDVVPVDWSTEDQWIHGPYSGLYDGKSCTWIFGRGSVDDKADLIAQLLAVNSLLEAGFKPRRTVVLAFGFDEEASGTEGAGKLAPYLEETYGRDGFAMLLDEGEGYGENLKEGVIVALLGVSEKGYFDASIEVFAPGGHSSIPPDHTSIGLLSLLIASLEANSHPPRLLRNGTAFAAAQCAVQHPTKPGKYPAGMKDLARRATVPGDDVALQKFAKALFEADPFFKVLSRTTQAVDLISGGVKINALPERAEAVINHRIAEHSTAQEVKKHIIDLVLPLAAEHNLSVQAFGDDIRNGSEAYRVVLSDAFYSPLEPSPVTPISNSPMYDVLSGTIIATLQSSKRYQADGVVVAPSLGLGKFTYGYTLYYWNLTRNIFRYSHRGDSDDRYNGLHTINEGVRAESFIEQIRFFTNLILNLDEVKSD
ncbi:hypothetical protein GYMLUDRAFT_168042 [Collybiopsis luxurians FD-317 M1]|uniref:Peptidase M20 dimerisation domain-containing protein n=1 Tax=Collybiopsis luxurians FD-317 M1 TaxID=944289 RepID=A0A0D0B9U5_9AGAR|nr:hypothetical protein GYMLUDRAFT_168042 [Collybiopsis luxurians FD-317 M1]